MGYATSSVTGDQIAPRKSIRSGVVFIDRVHDTKRHRGNQDNCYRCTIHSLLGVAKLPAEGTEYRAVTTPVFQLTSVPDNSDNIRHA